ncbi:MAG: hypothetical protein RIS70_3590 [Planctomycetota bacterium]
MRPWKLTTLLVLAAVVPIGLSNDQWLGDMKQWLKSIPVGNTSESPTLQTTAYGGSSTAGGGGTASGLTGGLTTSQAGGPAGGSGNATDEIRNAAGVGTAAGGSAMPKFGTSAGTGSSWTTSGTAAGSAVGSGTAGSSNAGSDYGPSKSGVQATLVNGSAANSVTNASGASAAGRDLLTSGQAANAVGKTEEGESPVEGIAFTNFQEVFRFDIQPKWVFSRWPRVTTVLADQALEGLRVPLVSGKNADDISGSLTYYFDHQKTLQRISFVGYTGDERRLARMVVEAYGMKPVPSLHAGLFMLSWNGTPRSVLRLTHQPVVRSSDTNRRLEVMLEINRPRAYYGLSREFKELLDQDHANAKW